MIHQWQLVRMKKQGSTIIRRVDDDVGFRSRSSLAGAMEAHIHERPR